MTEQNPQSDREEETGRVPEAPCEASRTAAAPEAAEAPAAATAAREGWTGVLGRLDFTTRKAVLAGLALLMALTMAVAWSVCFWFYSTRPLHLAGNARSVDVDIAAGMNIRQIAERTREAGVEVTVPAMLLAMRLTGSNAIHAGHYRFKKGVTLKSLIAKYRTGDVVKGTFRIADGATLHQTLQALSRVEEVRGSAATMTAEQLIQAIGASEKHLEGMLAPETYKFNWGTSDVTVLRIAYRHQKRALEEEWAARGENLAVKTPYEALILASIIEKETGQPADRPLVSSVFHNRLKVGMRLQTDPAVIYGQGPEFEGRLRTKHLRAPGPYNTYRNAGLPPTPIAMPSRASIHAALHPAKTELLYFVARGDGTTKFSTTLEEHERAVDIYQRGKK